MTLGIGDFVISFKGDAPGHPFRGNQYDSGSDAGESISASPETIHPGYNSLFTGPSKAQMSKIERNRKAQEEFMSALHDFRKGGKEPTEEEAKKIYSDVLKKWE